LKYLLVSIALVGAPALADDIRVLGTTLSSERIRNELLGVHLEGVSGAEDSFWTECIEPDGKTIYEFAGATLKGYMRVGENGLACFQYEGNERSGANCFIVMREGEGNYVFTSSSGTGKLFRTTRVVRNVTECPVASAGLS
tara:strand:+ start:41347 stop:41769 length:423 start_codon:yes stop_codon:yes gene_type:complete